MHISRPAVATFALLCPLIGRLATASPNPPAINVSVAARSLQPGELIVLTMTVGAEPADVSVGVFGKDVPAFKLADGVWRALVGIDVNQKAGTYTATIKARTPATTLRKVEPLIVRPRTFPTRTLRVDPDFVNPPASELARIENDAAFVREQLAHVTAERFWLAPFVRPVPDEANSRFGTRSIFNGEVRSPHSGTDFLSGTGTPVKAPNAGRVRAARELYYTGNTVILDHGLGVLSTLAHLSRVDVREGDVVSAGQIVGLVGATGRVTGPHLHWAFSVSGARIDPLSVLALLGEGAH